MKVEFNTSEIADILSLWRGATDLQVPMRDDFKIHMMKNRRALLTNHRRALLTNHRRTVSTWLLFLHSMTPIDGEPAFAELMAKVTDFKQWVNDELTKLAGLE